MPLLSTYRSFEVWTLRDVHTAWILKQQEELQPHKPPIGDEMDLERSSWGFAVDETMLSSTAAETHTRSSLRTHFGTAP